MMPNGDSLIWRTYSYLISNFLFSLTDNFKIIGEQRSQLILISMRMTEKVLAGIFELIE
jgi:hypothetical protein